MPSSRVIACRRFAWNAALTVAALLGAAPGVHARSDISWSIGISSPGVYYSQPPQVYLPPPPPVYYLPPPPVYHLRPPPVYYPRPPPVYYLPRTIYVQPAPVYVQPNPVFLQPQPYRYYYYGNSHDWRRAEWERRHWKRNHHHGRDRDRDWDGRRH